MENILNKMEITKEIILKIIELYKKGTDIESIKNSLDEEYNKILKCKYCGNPNNSKDEDVLCKDCQENFGHSFYSEL